MLPPLRGPYGLALCAALGACSLENEGAAPPVGAFNFPIAAALSPSAEGEPPPFLYVANANFDLRYNAGSVQSLDLNEVEDLLPDDCDACQVDDWSSALVGSVRIGSQASAIAIAPDGARLFVAVREDANLTTVNVDGATGDLACGNDEGGGECASRFRTVAERAEGTPTVPFQGDPVAIETGRFSDFEVESNGAYVLVAHRAGRVSLLVDRQAGAAAAPLEDERLPRVVARLANLPSWTSGLRFDRETRLAWLTNARTRSITRVGVALDAVDGEDVAANLFVAANPTLSGVDDGGDTRDVIFDVLPDGRRRAYLLSRRPEAVLIADVDVGSDSRLTVSRVVDVGVGPIKINLVKETIRGEERTLLLVSCYSSRDIYFVDPVNGAILAVLRGPVGPFALATDTVRKRVYIVDFRASVLRVATYAPLLRCLEEGLPEGEPGCDARILGTLGTENVMGEFL